MSAAKVEDGSKETKVETEATKVEAVEEVKADPTVAAEEMLEVAAARTTTTAFVVPCCPSPDKDNDEINLPVTPATLKELTLAVDHFEVLLTFVEELFAPVQSKLDRFRKDGTISFNLLWSVFPPGPAPSFTPQFRPTLTSPPSQRILRRDY